jgi:hypothetical protein
MTHQLRYETWADVQASEGFQELTGSPTVARLEYSGTDPEEARRKAEEAVKQPEVLAASVRTVDEGNPRRQPWPVGVGRYAF